MTDHLLHVGGGRGDRLAILVVFIHNGPLVGYRYSLLDQIGGLDRARAVTWHDDKLAVTRPIVTLLSANIAINTVL